jgi:excisionase family DNA binding protein
LLTVHEVAGIMRVSNMTVYRLIRAGDLKAARVGRGYRIRESEVDAYLDRGASLDNGASLDSGASLDHEVPE